MKYLALIYANEAVEPKPGSPEWGQLMEGYQAFSELLVKDEAMLGGEALQEAGTATSVRVRAGKTELTDGPFAETKETLGGFYLLEAPNLDKALEYAAQIPSAAYGTVEVRPVMTFD